MNESQNKQTPSLSVELVSGSVQAFTPSVQPVSHSMQRVSRRVQRASIGGRRVSSRVQRASIGVRHVSSRVQRASVGVSHVSSRVQRASVGVRRVSSRVQRASVGWRASRLFFHVSTESERTPNHALQRTAPRVTLAAADRPAACAHPTPAMSPQPARRAPQSLSLGSLGVLASLP